MKKKKKMTKREEKKRTKRQKKKKKPLSSARARTINYSYLPFIESRRHAHNAPPSAPRTIITQPPPLTPGRRFLCKIYTARRL